MSQGTIPGAVDILDRHNGTHPNLLFINKEFIGHKPGRLFAALLFHESSVNQLDELELMLSGVEADALAFPIETLAADIPVQPDAESARHNLVKVIQFGGVPVSSAVILDLESIRNIDSTGFTCAVFGGGRAILRGPGLAASAKYGGRKRVTFKDGKIGGFAVPNKLAGSNVFQVDLPFNEQLETVAKVKF